MYPPFIPSLKTSPLSDILDSSREADDYLFVNRASMVVVKIKPRYSLHKHYRKFCLYDSGGISFETEIQSA